MSDRVNKLEVEKEKEMESIREEWEKKMTAMTAETDEKKDIIK